MTSTRPGVRPTAIISSALLFVLACSAAGIAQRNYRAALTLFEADPPSALLKEPDRVGVAGLQAVSFSTSNGARIAAWYVASKNRAAVIITHGTNSDRATLLPEIRLLGAAGFGVLAFDWPGLGESEGPILWGAGAQDALIAAINWTSSRPDVDPQRLGGLGFSIGGFVMTQVAAADRRLRALVLESTPDDYESYVKFHFDKWGVLSEWPARWALRGSSIMSADASPVRLIGKLAGTPLLLIGQSEDPDVPASMVRALFAAARDPKVLWIIHGARHGDYLEAAGEEYERRLGAFFGANLLASAPRR